MVAYLREHGYRTPFGNRLKVPGTNYIVLGDGVFDPSEIPVGGDLTKYQDWEKRLVNDFIQKRTTLFGSLTPKGMLTVSKMVVRDDVIERNIEKSQKRFEPIACGTGSNDKATMLAFAKYVDARGEGVPDSLSTRGSRWCMYIELLAREEHNCFWVTPQELDVLYSSENEKKFRAVFKA
jgi:hypothetical protein